MSNGWAQMKWLAGKKGRDSRRWVIDNFPELVPRSNDKSASDIELDDREVSTGSGEAVNEESEAMNGHIGSSAS